MWLGIETTGRHGGVALVGDDGDLVLERILSVEAFHSEKVLPAVAALLEEAGAEGPELSGIGVCTGPGSYTGVRIGIATATGLSRGWG
ncbi:tRNA (adenosine(37)-N6)-threonylcarbamoyltransferase complex dimerization subunit type 1 TsaB, partial [Candidatus Fermentibacterales bacterium]|nr:tRNA (adenosine(37)-N6)-threonylcarbamoyltransferase complex dimerization subunit type 1 TsaB [Candidatus Fermentibacterales bacterium]